MHATCGYAITHISQGRRSLQSMQDLLLFTNLPTIPLPVVLRVSWVPVTRTYSAGYLSLYHCSLGAVSSLQGPPCYPRQGSAASETLGLPSLLGTAAPPPLLSICTCLLSVLLPHGTWEFAQGAQALLELFLGAMFLGHGSTVPLHLSPARC